MGNTINKLEMLVTVSRLLSSKLDIGDLLTTIMRLATRVVDCERASLYLLDEKTQELYFHVALDLDNDLKKIRLKLGEGIAGICARDGKSIISNNISFDERHTKKVDEKSGYTTRSLLTCPMIIKGKTIGVVQAINKLDGDFDEEDKNSFEAFASQAAVAIENSRLFNSVRDEKNKLENIFKIIGEGVVVTDENGVIKTINDSAVNFLGHNEKIHKDIKELLSSFITDVDIDTVIKDQKNLKFFIEKNEPQKLILECSLISENFLHQENSKELVWIFSDVTQSIIQSRISREFLSLVSHKFKTPITSMIGYSQILENIKCMDDMAQKAVKSIVCQGFKLSGLVDEMIDFSTIESKKSSDLKLSILSIDNFLDEIISFERSKFSGVEFEKKVYDNFDIEVDKDLFKKAIIELIKNGIKFNSKDKKRIELISKLVDDKKYIEIADNGNGIPSNEINKIFDNFYQIEQNFTGQTEGWGLGLSIVKKIVELHNSNITVESKISEGTTVRITL
ncbi:MAG: GAF domain-containing protein [Elusimicrobiales bacterium]|jgi:signal transduction histidine kinase|nr:GAF domain-containing protein [Elusimicrobiales bacterium]NLH39635.1 GAF domain-containing protein [Elusimicrobiota bacterium]